ncbi:PQQ-dependent sugar dehydrogenase [Palleronia pelagia]|uniref:Glucose/arabinose dehydrogenase, beta-propeller fold n=1 Tax=Palleronia pelagia TaxID=387096 RepID=A0A1H8BXK1_9RHOB|nr:sorbosone dehydrogenase family protein [Palleronia pelagia]SEM87319.1 Glucose/arabinose dehydrogenase, beta-propeller fold [Palleronia pelagia]
MPAPRFLAAGLLLALAGCGTPPPAPMSTVTGPDPQLPAPRQGLLPTVNIAPARGWPAGETPVAAAGLKVNAFYTGLDHPRWMHVLPNGDVLVAETNKQPATPTSLRGVAERIVMGIAGAEAPTADRISLLRDADGDGVAEGRTVLLEDLTSPFGMALLEGHLYVANTDALVRVPFRVGQTRVDATPEVAVQLPAGAPNRHWTKGLLAHEGQLYVSVGSNSDHGENGLAAERDRAAIWRVDPDTGRAVVFARGLRNPVGMDAEPATGALWTVVNERDELGDNLVPDYLAQVRPGDHFGWPWIYFGDRRDPRVDAPGAPAEVERPDYALGAHVAPLGLTFADGARLGQGPGAYVGLHGSWNRVPASGYSVVFVPFTDGNPVGQPRDVLTGFLDGDENALGRPVGVEIAADGALLVADDVGNTIWRVSRD